MRVVVGEMAGELDMLYDTVNQILKQCTIPGHPFRSVSRWSIGVSRSVIEALFWEDPVFEDAAEAPQISIFA